MMNPRSLETCFGSFPACRKVRLDPVTQFLQKMGLLPISNGTEQTKRLRFKDSWEYWEGTTTPGGNTPNSSPRTVSSGRDLEQAAMCAPDPDRFHLRPASCHTAVSHT
ncbi:hypothetical protein AAFF_G00074530 [Aldrovandia affinis]|uniref:Uncharacterized protein n=1 Tax=Aldrovandia affinis TaxID=143900 RepID=A0AAD7RYB9_9TELE|nr:hypothetical protein AAFF_G00074530 [Aldrovandia affinis]